MLKGKQIGLAVSFELDLDCGRMDHEPQTGCGRPLSTLCHCGLRKGRQSRQGIHFLTASIHFWEGEHVMRGQNSCDYLYTDSTALRNSLKRTSRWHEVGTRALPLSHTWAQRRGSMYLDMHVNEGGCPVNLSPCCPCALAA